MSYDGRMGLKQFEEYSPDVILLDIMLPEIDGMEICQRIRQISGVPIIMITAKGEVSDKVAGLDIGANDYITKPFAIQELQARIRVWLRSSDNEPKMGKPLAVADLCMDIAKHRVSRRNRQRPLC